MARPELPIDEEGSGSRQRFDGPFFILEAAPRE